MSLETLGGIGVLSLVCEFIDASLGGGYGTILSPVLIMMGISPLTGVPAILIGQLCGGLVGGFTHHLVGNVRLDFRPDKEISQRLKGLGYMPSSEDAKVVFILALCGIIGAIVGVKTALNIPVIFLKSYIGIMVFLIGILILIRLGKKTNLGMKGVIPVGLVSAFNKGMSGGGYGPLVTGGQVLGGRQPRNSVGSTTISEVTVCTVCFLTFLLSGVSMSWAISTATIGGAVVGAPLAAYTIRKAASPRLKLAIGLLTVSIGIGSLIKIFA